MRSVGSGSGSMVGEIGKKNCKTPFPTHLAMALSDEIGSVGRVFRQKKKQKLLRRAARGESVGRANRVGSGSQKSEKEGQSAETLKDKSTYNFASPGITVSCYGLCSLLLVRSRGLYGG